MVVRPFQLDIDEGGNIRKGKGGWWCNRVWWWGSSRVGGIGIGGGGHVKWAEEKRKVAKGLKTSVSLV